MDHEHDHSHGGHEHHNNGTDQEHHDHGMDHSMMNMAMSFHGGYSETILFDFWKINSIVGLSGSMVACFFLAFFYESLKLLKEMVYHKFNSPMNRRVVNKAHVLLTIIHFIQVIVSYLLMLIFMTYNTWLCLAVSIGATTGYFSFRWKHFASVDTTDHCF